MNIEPAPSRVKNPLIADARQRAAVAYAESHRVLADHRTDRAAARAHSRRIIALTRQHAAEEADFDLNGFLAEVSHRYALRRVRAALTGRAAA